MVVEEMVRAEDTLDRVMPKEAVLRSVLISSFGKLTPEQRSAIIKKLGVDWYLTLARKLEREMHGRRNGG